MEEEAEQKNYFKIPTCPKCCVIDRTEQKRGGVQKKRFHGNKNVFALDLLENPCVVKLMKKRQTTLMKNKREVVNFFISHKHPNIIEYLGFDDTTCDTHFCVISKRYKMDAFDFSRKYAKFGFSLEAARMILRKVLLDTAKAMEFCHSHQIIHCDIKPENILIERKIGSEQEIESGILDINGILCDLQNSKISPTDGTKPHFWFKDKDPNDDWDHRGYFGTSEFFAPELCESGNSFETDVWAYGVTVHDLCTQKLPFEISRSSHKFLGRSRDFSLSFPLAPLFLKCCELEPKQRFKFPEIVDDENLTKKIFVPKKYF